MMQPGEAPASPCRRQCGLNERQVCQGCGRTIDEIVQWSKMTVAEKQRCVEDASVRFDALKDLFE